MFRSKTKTMAVATGDLVIRLRPTDVNRPENPETWLRDSIDQIAALRRTTEVTSRTADGIIELQCGVKYGPVFGAYQSDLTKRLLQIAAGFESAVMNYRRIELRTVEDINAQIAELDVESHDITRPLAVCQRSAQDAMRLRQLLESHAGTTTAASTYTPTPAPTEPYKPVPLTEAEKVEH